MKYRPGKTNVVADALSRIPQINNIISINTTLIKDEDLIERYKSDKYFDSIYEILTQNTKLLTAKKIARVKHYKLYQKRIYFKKDIRLAIPKDKELRTKILQEHHDSKLSGHLGVEKTLQAIMKLYF